MNGIGLNPRRTERTGDALRRGDGGGRLLSHAAGTMAQRGEQVHYEGEHIVLPYSGAISARNQSGLTGPRKPARPVPVLEWRHERVGQ